MCLNPKGLHLNIVRLSSKLALLHPSEKVLVQIPAMRSLHVLLPRVSAGSAVFSQFKNVLHSFIGEFKLCKGECAALSRTADLCRIRPALTQ